MPRLAQVCSPATTWCSLTWSPSIRARDPQTASVKRDRLGGSRTAKADAGAAETGCIRGRDPPH